MEYNHVRQHSPSFRHRIKSTICCFSYHDVEPASPSSSGSDDEFRHMSLVSRSPEKGVSFFSRIGGRAFRRQSNTSEYRYDPVSYALNFEDEFALRSFTSRLPPSPPPSHSRFPAAIVTCSH